MIKNKTPTQQIGWSSVLDSEAELKRDDNQRLSCCPSTMLHQPLRVTMVRTPVTEETAVADDVERRRRYPMMMRLLLHQRRRPIALACSASTPDSPPTDDQFK